MTESKHKGVNAGGKASSDTAGSNIKIEPEPEKPGFVKKGYDAPPKPYPKYSTKESRNS